MKKWFYIMLLALPLCLTGCNDDDNEEPYGPFIAIGFGCRLDLYNADGTACEIDQLDVDRGRIEIQKKECEKESFVDISSDVSGNSMYFDLSVWSHEHSDHLNNIVFTMRITSKTLFGDDKGRDITICADLRNVMNYTIKSVTSSDLQVNSELLFVEDEQAKHDYVLPIRITLDDTAQDK